MSMPRLDGLVSDNVSQMFHLDVMADGTVLSVAWVQCLQRQRH